jgi:hypothetical protein
VFILLLGPPILQLRNFVRDAHAPGGVLNVQTYDSLDSELNRTPNTSPTR